MTATTETQLHLPHPRVRWLALGLAVTTGLLVGGCRSGDDSRDVPRTGSSITSRSPSQTADDSGLHEAGSDTCDIVSDEVTSEVLGIEVERREPHMDASGKVLSCIKGTKRVTDMSMAYYVSVSIIPTAGSMLLDRASSQAGGVPVSGLGDEAVYLSGLGTLLVTDGGDGVQIQVVKAGRPGEQQDVVTVAEDVLDRRG